MTIALAIMTDGLVLEDAPGIKARTARAVARQICQWAAADGTYRHGKSQRTLADFLEMGVSTIKRAEARLVEVGVLVRDEVGGGRKSTRWRVDIERLAELCRPAVGQQMGRRGPGQKHQPGFWLKMYRRAFARLKPRAVETHEIEVITPVAGRCEHGDTDEIMANGLPRCPGCRFRHAKGPQKQV